MLYIASVLCVCTCLQFRPISCAGDTSGYLLLGNTGIVTTIFGPEVMHDMYNLDVCRADHHRMFYE